MSIGSRYLAAILIATLVPALAAGQGVRRFFQSPATTVDYNGAFAFTRIRYGSAMRGFGGSTWSHDYPAADRNVSAIIDYATHIRIRLDGPFRPGVRAPADTRREPCARCAPS